MRLGKYLTENGISNVQFADLLDVERETVRRWRNGERMPRPTEIAKINRATKGAVTADDLLAQLGKPEPRDRQRAGAA